MKKHFYLSCTGQVYCSKEHIDDYDATCPFCGDSDEYMGYHGSEEEAFDAYMRGLYRGWEDGE